MQEPWRMAVQAHLRLAPKSMYMPAETMTGKPIGETSTIFIAGINDVLSSRYLSRDRVCVTEQTHEKIDNVGTKRNAVEQY